MKAIWKILIGAAAVAAVAPYQVKKDEETGDITLKAATWAGTYSKNGDGHALTVKLLPGIIKGAECECCDDECQCCGEECCCGEEAAEDEDGITIEIEADGDGPADEPKPEEA